MFHVSLIIVTALSLLVGLVPTANAYLPSSRTVLGRMAKNHGKNVLSIEQDVIFRSEAEPVTVREKWTVENGESMRVSVSGGGGAQEDWRFDVVYKDNRRHFLDPQGQLKTGQTSAEFIEPYLHYRSGRSVLDALVRSKVVPSAMTKEPKKNMAAANAKYQDEPHMRLARAGGNVTYALGEPTPAQNEATAPGFWVDQDSFLFRRLRFPSQAEVFAERHGSYVNGVRLPSERTVTWGNNSVTIRVLSVRSLADSAATTITANSLLSAGPGAIKASASKLPDLPQVKEFYQRFR